LELNELVFPAYRWRVRVYSIYLFVVFDYLLTGLFIEGFGEEANRAVRAFMVGLDSVPVGLAAFTLAFYGPVYVALCYLSNTDWGRVREAEFFDSLARRIPWRAASGYPWASSSISRWCTSAPCGMSWDGESQTRRGLLRTM